VRWVGLKAFPRKNIVFFHILLLLSSILFIRLLKPLEEAVHALLDRLCIAFPEIFSNVDLLRLLRVCLFLLDFTIGFRRRMLFLADVYVHTNFRLLFGFRFRNFRDLFL
jgi:hypothetical protein